MELQQHKLPESVLDEWLLLSSSGGRNAYRPAGEAIYLINEAVMTFTDEIFVIPAGMVSLVINWLGVDLKRIKLDVTLSLFFGDPPINVSVIWDYPRDSEIKCKLECYRDQRIYNLSTREKNFLVERLIMLFQKFPQQLRNHIKGPIEVYYDKTDDSMFDSEGNYNGKPWKNHKDILKAKNGTKKATNGSKGKQESNEFDDSEVDLSLELSSLGALV